MCRGPQEHQAVNDWLIPAGVEELSLMKISIFIMEIIFYRVES
jgi:hypothetical protein